MIWQNYNARIQIASMIIRACNEKHIYLYHASMVLTLREWAHRGREVQQLSSVMGFVMWRNAGDTPFHFPLTYYWCFHQSRTNTKLNHNENSLLFDVIIYSNDLFIMQCSVLINAPLKLYKMFTNVMLLNFTLSTHPHMGKKC